MYHIIVGNTKYNYSSRLSLLSKGAGRNKLLRLLTREDILTVPEIEYGSSRLHVDCWAKKLTNKSKIFVNRDYEDDNDTGSVVSLTLQQGSDDGSQEFLSPLRAQISMSDSENDYYLVCILSRYLLHHMMSR